MEKKDIKRCNAEVLACEIFSLTCSTLIYRRKAGDFEIDVLYQEYEKILLDKLQEVKESAF